MANDNAFYGLPAEVSWSGDYPYGYGLPPPVGWPGFWAGGEYPARRRPAGEAGWYCGGCEHWHAPSVLTCPAGPAETSVARCKPAREGGMCSCGEPEEP